MEVVGIMIFKYVSNKRAELAAELLQFVWMQSSRFIIALCCAFCLLEDTVRLPLRSEYFGVGQRCQDIDITASRQQWRKLLLALNDS